jgi:surface antigen
MFITSNNTTSSQKSERADMNIGNNLASFKLVAKASLVSAALITLSACSVSSTTSQLPTEDQIITGSITKPVQPEGIETADAEIIKSVVAQSDQSNILAWQNPETGNKGTITAIDKFVGSHGQKCKKFQTTVDTFMGISLYNGETCELKKGFWVLSWFLKEQG